MANKPTEYVEIEVVVHRATEKAVLVSDDGDDSDATWLPLSQIKGPRPSVSQDSQVLEVAEWIAQREGLI
jgi:hypothetical protein